MDVAIERRLRHYRVIRIAVYDSRIETGLGVGGVNWIRRALARVKRKL